MLVFLSKYTREKPCSSIKMYFYTFHPELHLRKLLPVRHAMTYFNFSIENDRGSGLSRTHQMSSFFPLIQTFEPSRVIETKANIF